MIRSSVFTYGFRFLAAIATFSVLGALVFAVDGDEGLIDNVVGPLTAGWKGGVGAHVGYVILVGIAVAAGGLAGVLVAFRDGEATSQAQVLGTEALPLTRTPTHVSFLPLIMALLVITALVGLTSSPGLFQASLFGMAGFGGAWTVRAWANRASGDDAANDQIYHRVIDPLRIPLISAGVVAFIAIGLSRLLLATDKTASILVFVVVATIIFGLAALLSARPSIDRNVLTLMLIVAAVALLIGAIVSIVVGQREFHHVGPAGAEESHTEEGAAAAPDAVVIIGATS